jgi:hypothetical protein
MKLPLNWILQEPIDMEHKEYVLLDYISKVDKELDEFRLYPTFQELTLHLANLNSISTKLSYIELKVEPEENDEEILLDNIVYKKLTQFKEDELKYILEISKESHNRLKDYFLIAKSIWAIVFESVLIKNLNKGLVLTKRNSNNGYLKFQYNNLTYLYEFNISKINKKYDEKKCTFKLIQKGEKITKKISDKKLFFEAQFDSEFPLEGCLLSIVKRKVINYITQTIKLDELKENNEEKK